MDIIYAKESFIICFLISKSIVCRKRRWFLTYFQPVQILTASYKIIVSWNLSFRWKKELLRKQFPTVCTVLSSIGASQTNGNNAMCEVSRETFSSASPKNFRGGNIFYILKRTPIFIKQPLCDNRNFLYVRRRERRKPLGASVYFIPTQRNVYFIRVG